MKYASFFLILFTFLFQFAKAQSSYNQVQKIKPHPEHKIPGKGNFIVLVKSGDTIDCKTIRLKGTYMGSDITANGKTYKGQEIIALQNKNGFFVRRLLSKKERTKRGPKYSRFMQKVNGGELLEEYLSVFPDLIVKNQNRIGISEKQYFRWLSVPNTSTFFKSTERKLVKAALKDCTACKPKLKRTFANLEKILDQYFSGKLK